MCVSTETRFSELRFEFLGMVGLPAPLPPELMYAV